MRATKLLAAILLVVMLLTGSAAVAIGSFDKVSIRTADMRIGDVRHVQLSIGDPVEHIFLIEGYSTAIDRWGAAHPTLSVRADRYVGGALEGAERCHVLRGSKTVIQAERLAGEGYGGRSSSGGSNDVISGRVSYVEDAVGIIRFDGGLGCGLTEDRSAGRAFREGERVRLSELMPGAFPRDPLTKPARSTTFQGAPALAFRVDLRDVVDEPEVPADTYVELVAAQGFPGIVRESIHGSEGGEVIFDLLGFTAGTGEVVTISGNESVPTRSPTATFVPFDGRRLDDAALGFPFPYAEAYSALMRDPRAGANEWFEEHPDAFLTYAALPCKARPRGRPSWPPGRGRSSTRTDTYREDGPCRARRSRRHRSGGCRSRCRLMRSKTTGSPLANGCQCLPPRPSMVRR